MLTNELSTIVDMFEFSNDRPVVLSVVTSSVRDEFSNDGSVVSIVGAIFRKR